MTGCSNYADPSLERGGPNSRPGISPRSPASKHSARSSDPRPQPNANESKLGTAVALSGVDAPRRSASHPA
jgi:hypothetical protein